MTFWQENYGFVKEVYDYRMAKYQEWMDNLEAIVSKVLSQDVQYTYKEFKNIQDTLGSLCRDLEKEGMKEWLDMMLEKVAMRVSDEEGQSSRDKEFKKTERKRLEALIERHDSLMPRTIETQEKVETYARCYSYGDDISQLMKTLEEMHHLSTKEIHPHNMNMVEEQIEKAEKVINTVDSSADQFEEYIKRGKKLLTVPNCAPFLGPLIEKLETVWKNANIKSKERLDMLTNVIKDWESYDELRTSIGDPCEKLESELKKYRKFYDPAMGAKKLAQRKMILEECKRKADEQFENIKKCYNTIVVLAGDEKKEFLDREVSEVEEKRQIIGKCEAKLKELEDYNNKLSEAHKKYKELDDWARPSNQKLKDLCTNEEMSPEDRVNEIIGLQAEGRIRIPLVEPLEAELNSLLTVEDLELSETARNLMTDFKDLKEFITSLVADIEKEAGSISQDQKFFADYITGVKEVKPWVEESEKEVKAPIPKPQKLDDALAILENLKQFDENCLSKKEKLEAAGKARSSMEKPSASENLYDPLTQKWGQVKKFSEERIKKITTLVNTWQELQKTTEDLAIKMNEVPKQDEPNIAELEKVFNSMKELFTKKKDLLAKV
ncbi:UNVERIFIED_CONTAM: hypothetical protein RMT77_005658 [Armadillidium vulgare]